MKKRLTTLFYCTLMSATIASANLHAQEDSLYDEVTTVKEANFINSLTGKVPGLIINPNAAGLGSASRIIMRGPNSLDGYDLVLLVIDGVPMHNASAGDLFGGIYGGRTGTDGIADINPEDIESISVISGPSAAVLYGYDALNGAIIINTKKGNTGLEIDFSNNTSFSSVIKSYDFQNTYTNNVGQHKSWGEKLAEPSTYDPYDFFNTGINIINNLSVSYGSKHNITYASFASTNSTGIIPTSEYNRYNVTLRNTTKLFNDRLIIELGGQYISQNHKNLNADGYYFNPLQSIYLFPRGENFEDIKLFERYNSTNQLMEQYWPTNKFSIDAEMQNPYWVLNRMVNEAPKQRYIIHGNISYKITDWLDVRGTINVDNYSMNATDKRYATTLSTLTNGSPNGYYSYSEQNDRALYSNLLVNFHKTWKDWNVQASLAGSFRDIKNTKYQFGGPLKEMPNAFTADNLYETNAKGETTGWMTTTGSAYATVGVNWKNMIFLDLAGRNEWEKVAIADKFSSVFYPSVGLSFVASELFDIPQTISYLKVRGSISKVGKPSEILLSSSGKHNYSIGKVRSQEIGMDLRLLRDRISLGITYYNSVASDQIFDIPTAMGTRQIQGPALSNSGIEGIVGYSDSYAGGKVRFSTNLTLSHNNNRIDYLLDEKWNTPYLNMGTLGTYYAPKIRYSTGGTIGDLYTRYQLRTSPQGYIWQNEYNEVRIEELTKEIYLGSTLPDFHAGWNANLSYAGINLSIQINGRFGGIAISNTQALLDRYGVSQTTATARDNGGVDIGYGRQNDARQYYETTSELTGSHYCYDATNIRLAELSLSYDLPKKWFKNRVGITVGLTGKNLCMIYCKAPFDPEMTAAPRSNLYQGLDYFMTPGTRSLGFNVRVNFK